MISRRTELKPGKPLARKGFTSLRTTELRRAAIRRTRTRDAIPLAVRAEVHARSSRCEFGGCWAAVDHLHHRLRRSQGGPHTAANLLGLCSSHHGWVHDNPLKAVGRGLLVPRNSDEARALLAAAREGGEA